METTFHIINNANPNDTENIIIIQSNDNKFFCIDKKIISQSSFFKDMFDSNIGSDDQNVPIMHHSATSNNLIKIFDFLVYIDNNPNEVDEISKWVNTLGDNSIKISEWLNNYINIDHKILFSIIVLADFLHIQLLLDFASCKIASEIRKMTTTQNVNGIFN